MAPSAYLLSSLLLTTIVLLFAISGADGAYEKSGNCIDSECPAYTVIHSQKEFEIRKYNTSKWMATKPIMSKSYKKATNIGFQKYVDLSIYFIYISSVLILKSYQFLN